MIAPVLMGTDGEVVCRNIDIEIEKETIIARLNKNEKLATNLDVFKTVLLANTPQNILLAALLHFPGQE